MNRRLAVFATIISIVLASASAAGAATTHGIRVEACSASAGTPSSSWEGYYGTYAPYGYYGPGGRYYRAGVPYAGHRYYDPGTPPELRITFVNTSGNAAKIVDFGLLAKGHIVAIVRDVGTFSQGAKIEHAFGLDPNVFPLGTSLYECIPLHITYHNGATWDHPQR